ncbi:MAG TPA: XrtA system polysaccharide chain length determinant, partial [Oleiagrimonas sp.]|nr:XrtA system polysaccharide chain length determinant [Oleiagrimonas sp.]
KYEASAEVYADTSALTNPLLHGIAVQPDVRQRLQIITRTLLSRPNLKSVADKTGLSLRATTPAAESELLDQLGASVKIRDAGARNLYDITYDDHDRNMAQKVVQAFLQILMNKTLGEKSTSSASAQSFLQQQVDDYSDRLNAAERKLADFKKANIGYVPGDGGDYSQQLTAAQTKLETLEGQYRTTQGQLAMIENQMRGMATDPGSPGIDPRVQQIDSQIAAYQKQLDQLLLRYTDAYPDVIAARRMIKQLKTRRADLQKNASKPGSLAAIASDNPVYQGRQQGLYTLQVQSRALASQIAQQKQLIGRLKANAGKSTDVQATLQQLTRNYNVTKKQYDELMSRLNTSELSQAASQSGNNLKFRIVNPPVVPLVPSSPKRGLLLLVVFVLAILIGGAFAYFLHLIRPVFTSLRNLRNFSDVPVIGTFHMIESRARRARKRREIFGFCAGVGLLAVVLGLGFAYNAHLAGMVQHVFRLGVS